MIPWPILGLWPKKKSEKPLTTHDQIRVEVRFGAGMLADCETRFSSVVMLLPEYDESYLRQGGRGVVAKLYAATMLETMAGRLREEAERGDGEAHSR